jgi:hypothetical protein
MVISHGGTTQCENGRTDDQNFSHVKESHG